MEAPYVDASITLRNRRGAVQQKDAHDSLSAVLSNMLSSAGAGALSGRALKLAVALAEAQTKASATSGLPEHSLSISQLPFTQAFNDSLFHIEAGEVADEAADEQQVASTNPKERLYAAAKVLGHTGSTLVYTPPNVRPTVLDYHHAFKHGILSPKDVAERVIAFLDKHNSQHYWLSAFSAEHIRYQAAAAAARYAAGKYLSVLDGVPFVVKDCIDALPYQTSFGTTFMGKLRRTTSDAPCVTNMRALGAVLLGKAAMPELDSIVTSGNASCNSTLNPHNADKLAGGGSAGCCAAVAAGLCPLAIGTDAGGATVVPGSFCGVVGLKPSKGRLADDHAAHGSQSSLTSTTPIANSVADALLLYAALANTSYPDAEAPRILSLPKRLLQLQERCAANEDYVLGSGQPLKGMKVGMCKQWVGESSADVAAVIEVAVARLEQLGATVVDVSLPELQEMQAAHLVTFSKELAADAARQGWLNDNKLRSQLSLDSRMFVANALKFKESNYKEAQLLRANILSSFESALKEVDVIMTPATPEVAPAKPQEPNSAGAYDLAAACRVARFGLAASLTGLPSLVMPAGRQGGAFLPVGVQFIGKAWAEPTLLRTAAALEQQMLEDGYPRQVARTALNPCECAIGAHPIAAEVTRKTWAVKHYKGKKQVAH